MKFNKLNTSGDVWITSDTHYNHKNICRGVTNWRTQEGGVPVNSTRDFRTINEMNDVIVNNINSKVGQNDTLIHLGDVSFGGFDKLEQFLDRLICKNIHLVLGNHDHHIENNRGDIQSKFLSVQHYMQTNIDDVDFVLCHYPIQSWNGLNKGVIHLHGHVHLPNNKKFGQGRKMDVGVDGNNIQPYKISDIVGILNKRLIISELNDDHHLDGLLGVVG